MLPTKRLDGGICECGRPIGQCTKGDMDYCDAGEDSDCPTCGGSGVLEDECECQAIEDICCCLHPRPPICPECGGNG
jgi:hypothetical protein